MYQIISENQAKKLGMKRYFTGKPCGRNHFAERYVSGRQCIYCHASNSESWREDNRDYHSDLSKKWRDANKARHSESISKWRENNANRVAIVNKHWYERNRDRALENNRRWREENKDRYAELIKEWRINNRDNIAARKRERYATDPNFKMKMFMRDCVCRTLTAKKESRTTDLLGYTPDQLRQHIERQFLPGMGWDNRCDWHIDHIIPIAHFFEQGESDPSVINCLSNLRPVWADMNRKKGAKLETLL